MAAFLSRLWMPTETHREWFKVSCYRKSTKIINSLRVSGGLSPTGDSNGGCSSSTGQVYARASVYEEYFAIMYSW